MFGGAKKHRFEHLMLDSHIDIKRIRKHPSPMRTTLTLDPDVAELAARQAKARGLSLGKTISELVRRGLNAPTSTAVKGGLVVFQLPPDSPKVTTADVRRLESEGA